VIYDFLHLIVMVIFFFFLTLFKGEKLPLIWSRELNSLGKDNAQNMQGLRFEPRTPPKKATPSVSQLLSL